MSNEQVNSILRVLNILECFAYENSEWTLSNLAERTGLPISTLHRQLNTLISSGYLKQNASRKTYQIGNQLILFACSVLSKYDLRNIALPRIQSLSKSVGETVHLCQLDGFNMFYVEKVESAHSVSCSSRIGSRLPAHVTSAGKILLSGQSRDFIDEYCNNMVNVPAFTKNTIADPDTLRNALDVVRAQGYAVDNEEFEEGLMCVATPIFNMDGQIIAAVSVSGPTYRFAEKSMHFLPIIRDCAQNISSMLGAS